MPTTEQDLPCLQNPRSYQGQSLILDSGSMCRNGHSLLLHSPARGQHRHNTLKEYTWSKYSHRAHLWNTEPTDQTWSRSSIQASWSCRIHGETRTGLPSCTVLWASAYTPPSSLHWCDDTDTSHLGVETKKKRYSTDDGTSFSIHTQSPFNRSLLIFFSQIVSKQLPQLQFLFPQNSVMCYNQDLVLDLLLPVVHYIVKAFHWFIYVFFPHGFNWYCF